MKNLTIFGILIILTCLGCDKFEPLFSSKDKTFPDYDYTAVYFPIQYPIRTIDLATDARIENSNDLEHKFHIGISMGGVYENKIEREVRFEYDPTLLPDGLRGVPSVEHTQDSMLVLLPQEYFELSPSSGSLVTIPVNEFNGLIEVQLKEAFFEDPLALTNTYVIPLRITEAIGVDSVLSGAPLEENPVKTNSAHWDVDSQPHDFTLFMVKFINPYHGQYLIRGVDYWLDSVDNRADTTIYRDKYIERNKITKLKTGSLTRIITNHTGRRISDDGQYALMLDIDNSGNVNVSSLPNASYSASGSGEFLSRDESQEAWGGETRKTFYLHYNYLDGIEKHEVYDTLVFLHTGTQLEWFNPYWE